MVVKTSEEIINHMWWSGFCHDTIEFSATTISDPDGVSKREEFVREHINSCHECALAFLWKNAEGELARRLGAFEFFAAGGDLFERFGERAREEFSKMLQETRFPNEMLDFLQRAALRHGKPYPGRRTVMKGTWKR